MNRNTRILRIRQLLQLCSRTRGTGLRDSEDELLDSRLDHRHGPEGGAAGGQVIATGTPEQVARIATSYTGQFVKPLLERPRRSGNGGGRPRRDRRGAEAAAP